MGVQPAYQHLPFLNAVLIVETRFPLPDFFEACRQIENALGRQRQAADRYAPRVVDIDLLYADGLVQTEGNLRLPHPQCFKRRFVLQPLADVRPELVLPGADAPVRALLARLPEGERVARFAGSW